MPRSVLFRIGLRAPPAGGASNVTEDDRRIYACPIIDREPLAEFIDAWGRYEQRRRLRSTVYIAATLLAAFFVTVA